jgi:hypothetical protein
MKCSFKKRKKLKNHMGPRWDPAWYAMLQMWNVVIIVISRFWTLKIWRMARRQFSEDNIVQM